MANHATGAPARTGSLDRTIERLREQLAGLTPFFAPMARPADSSLEDFDARTEQVISSAFGLATEMLEAYEYAEAGDAAGLVNFPDEAPEGGDAARDAERERLNQRKRVLESCIAELEARRAGLAKKHRIGRADLIGPQVAEYMTPDVTTVQTSATLRDAGRLMQDRKVGSLLVTDDRNYVGLITDTDLARHVVASGMDPLTPVKQCMRTPLPAIACNRPILEAVRAMKDQGTRHLAVTEGTDVIGIISVSNILRYYSGVL